MRAEQLQREATVVRLIETEARYLDRRLWDEWLELYTDDAVYWMPAWRDDGEMTQDPDRELSLIYYESRKRLEERVWRARSGLAVSSTPLVRTMHTVSNIAVETGDTDQASASANWSVHVYDPRPRSSSVFFGLYDFEFAQQSGDWLISRKKITLLNDHLPTFLDFYTA
jgi:benzoate/toluate 1,2-dioxygenase beta subunit/2,4,5-trichlorophenoxyacetic acid oxygenase 2